MASRKYLTNTTTHYTENDDERLLHKGKGSQSSISDLGNICDFRVALMRWALGNTGQHITKTRNLFYMLLLQALLIC